MARITWAENYGVIRERLRGFEGEVRSMNTNGWMSKAQLHSFASRLYDFNKRAVPQLLQRCSELEDALDKDLSLVEERDRVIAAMRENQNRLWEERESDNGDSLERERLELELEKAHLEMELLKLQVQRLEEGRKSEGDAMGA